MALRKSKQVNARLPALSADGAGDALCVVSEYTVEAALALNDIVEMAAVPAGMLIADATFVCDDTDSGGAPAIVLNIGLMSGDYLAALDGAGAARTCGAELFSAITTAQAGGAVRASAATAFQQSSGIADRSVGIKVATAAATLTAGAKWRLILWLTPAPIGFVDA